MSVLSTLFGTLIAARQIGWQPDAVTDLIKIGSVIFVGAAVISCVVWSLIQRDKMTILRGAASGFLTALLIVPLPVFASSFKNELSAISNRGREGLFEFLLEVIFTSLRTGLMTFQTVTKASLLALTASLILGAFIAWRCLPAPTDPTQP